MCIYIYISIYLYIYIYISCLLYAFYWWTWKLTPEARNCLTQGCMSYRGDSLPRIAGAHTQRPGPRLNSRQLAKLPSPVEPQLPLLCRPAPPLAQSRRPHLLTVCLQEHSPKPARSSLSQSLSGDPDFRHTEDTHTALSAWVPVPSLGSGAPMSPPPSCGV